MSVIKLTEMLTKSSSSNSAPRLLKCIIEAMTTFHLQGYQMPSIPDSSIILFMNSKSRFDHDGEGGLINSKA